MITVVDYGLGNLGSIMNMMRRLDIPAQLSRDPTLIANADRIILPGVGAFDEGMAAIGALGLQPALDCVALERRRPVLGVCLGMQLIGNSSEEGERKGLGWIAARARRFRLQPEADGRIARVTHMGWNYIQTPSRHPLFEGADENSRFYFVHSYCMDAVQPDNVIAVSWHCGDFFAAGLAAGNIAGVQFHPEKSHHYGMRLYRNFAAWQPECAR